MRGVEKCYIGVVGHILLGRLEGQRVGELHRNLFEKTVFVVYAANFRGSGEFAALNISIRREPGNSKLRGD